MRHSDPSALQHLVSLQQTTGTIGLHLDSVVLPSLLGPVVLSQALLSEGVPLWTDVGVFCKGCSVQSVPCAMFCCSRSVVGRFAGSGAAILVVSESGMPVLLLTNGVHLLRPWHTCPF